MVVVKTAIRLNGLSGLLITKLDVLTGIPKLKIVTSYNCGPKKIEYMPPELDALEACEPVYEEFHGWEEDIGSVRKFVDLPVNTRRYLQAMEEMAGVPLMVVSVGPARDETIVLEYPF